MYGLAQKKDRTLDELDKAIAATQATATKVDKLVKEKEAHSKAAETRKTKLIAVLNSVCDDCTTIPCLLPASGNSSGACVVCGNSVDRVDPKPNCGYGYYGYSHSQPAPVRVPSTSELKRELATHMGTASGNDYHEYYEAGGVGYRMYGGSKKEEFKAPTRKDMLAKADQFVKEATAALNEARELKTACDKQKQTLQQEQQQLLGRLGGVKRGASDDSCSICLNAAKTHVLTPCGHKCMCDQCARAFCAGSQCPICRGRVQSVVRVYE